MTDTFSFHDAEMYSLYHDVLAQTVECMFRNVEGEQVILCLEKVSGFRCTDFGLQNVALDLLSTTWQPISEDDLQGYVSWMRSTSDGEKLESAEAVKATVQDVLSGRRHFVFLIPSWGAQFAAIAEAVLLKQ